MSHAPADEELPGLAVLTAPERLAKEVSVQLTSGIEVESLTIDYVRYKPATSCVVAFRASLLSGEDTKPISGYGKAFKADDFADAVAKAESRAEREDGGLPGFVCLRDEHVIVYFFPNDAKMKGLGVVTQPKKLQRLLYQHDHRHPESDWRISDRRMQPDILRYKPEKRAVIRVVTKVVNRHNDQRHPLRVYVRAYADGRGQHIERVMRLLSEAVDGLTSLAVPRPIAYLDETQLLLVEHLDGETMTELMTHPNVDRIVEQAAVALAALHEIKIDGLPRLHVADLEGHARATETSLCVIAPGLANTLAEILDTWRVRTQAIAASEARFVHGDFYYGQVMIGADRTGILDFDRSYLGDPLADVGNFCAHARLMQMEGRIDRASDIEARFVRAYEVARGERIDPAAVRQYTVFGLFQLTVRPFRSLRAGWRPQVEALVNECVRLTR